MLFNIVKGSPTKTIQTVKSCPHKVKLYKYLQQFIFHMIKLYLIHVQNGDLHALSFVKSGDLGLLWNNTKYQVSKGLHDNDSKYTFSKLQYSWKKNITELKTQGTCTCIASYHHIFKTLFARKTPKIASVMID